MALIMQYNLFLYLRMGLPSIFMFLLFDTESLLTAIVIHYCGSLYLTKFFVHKQY